MNKKFKIYRHSALGGFLCMLMFMMISPLSLISQEERKINREGSSFFGDKDYNNAELKYKKAFEMNPEKYDLVNNMANSQYRGGKFEESAMTYENFLKMTGDRKEKADAFYNIGNSYLQGADYEKSIEAYRNALRMDPTHDESRYNMSVATKIQEQQQSGQDQQEQQDDGDGEGEGEDKKKNDQKEDEGSQDGDDDKEEENEDQQKKPEPKENEMTREEMERFLESLQQQEKEVQEKVNKEKFEAQQRVVEKEW